MTDFGQLMDDAVQAGLAPHRFAFVAPYHWIERVGPLRRIFGLTALKGGQYAVCWGFALDFVPVPQKQRLRWKRGDKDARYDLCIRAIDDPRFASSVSRSPDHYSFTHIPGYETPNTSQLLKIASCATQLARTDFDRVRSIGDFVGMFEEQSRMDFRGLSLANFVQTDIAWGLALLAAGRNGEAHISRFCDAFRLRRDDPVLLKAEELARASAALGDQGPI